MPSWKGDPTNPVPNPIQESIDRSEKMVGANRALHVRRDTDTQKDFTISLYDIDEAILNHLNINLQLQVEDVGKQVKVPVFMGAPELWTSAQRDGYVRDQQGKIILPLMILKRTTSENDQSLKYFNRYLSTPAIKLFSPKNQYTKFNLLAGKNAPVHEVFNIIFPSHMLLTYHCIVWTEYVVQMNKLIESIQYNTNDYWGSTKGFRFRTRVETFGHTTEMQAGEDRIVKTEFDLITHGYILPDSVTNLERHRQTTQKSFTPKKVIMGLEVVGTDTNLDLWNKNRQKWQNPNYPNLQADVPIPTPPMSFVDSGNSTNVASNIVTTLTNVSQPPAIPIGGGSGVDNNAPYLRIVPPPTNPDTSLGQDGYVSYDSKYFYIYSNGKWRQVAISAFS